MNPRLLDPRHASDDADLFARRLALGLAELDGTEAPPDVATAVAQRLAAGRVRPAPAFRWFAAAAALLAIGVTLAVYAMNAGSQPDVEPVAAVAPQDVAAFLVRSKADVAELPKGTTRVRGEQLDHEAIVALARSPKLAELELVSCAEVDAKVLQALAKLERLTLLRLEGVFTAPPPAYAVFGGMAKLADLALVDSARQPGLNDACLAAIPTFGMAKLTVRSAGITGAFFPALKRGRVRDLSLAGCTALASERLSDLPARLATLDLTGTGVRDAATRCRHLLDCTVTCSNGLRLQMARDPSQQPERLPWTVTLRPRTGSEYLDAGYSFRRRSARVEEHDNYVDLVWDRCGQVHFHCWGGQENRIRDLGEEPLSEVRAVPAGEWSPLRSSFQPRVGHTYLFEVREADVAETMIVVFHVAAFDEKALAIRWHHLDEQQDPGVWKERGAAGCMGQCGGPHDSR